ncbi:MAG: asparagine synthase C-terminal domain-containing protein [Pseudomonadota bacterium]
MYRFFAITWASENKADALFVESIERRLKNASPHGWRCVWRRDGVIVFDAGSGPGALKARQLSDNQGVVLGRIFRKGRHRAVEAFSDQESHAVTTSHGEHLAREYWGTYVAMFSGPDSSVLRVFRDPSGALPCFVIQHKTVRLLFSDMEDAAAIDSFNFTVNWQYLAADFMIPQAQKTATGLNEVDTILPAECRTYSGSASSSEFCWDPFEFSRLDPPTCVDRAADLMRTTIADTLAALSTAYERVAVSLGGLDSSIALNCLARAPEAPDCIALNYFTSSPGGDERSYARCAASYYDTPLFEIELNPEADISALKQSNRLASPPGMFDFIGLTAKPPFRLAAEKGAEAIFTGIGGDNVFCQPAFDFSALDYVRNRSFDSGSLPVILHSARYGRSTFWRTLGAAMKEAVAPSPCGPYVRDRLYGRAAPPFVKEGFCDADAAATMLHPLLQAQDVDLKSKFLQILTCTFFSVDYYDHWDTQYSVERVNAFMQQPIIEAALRIPTWLMTKGGVDRALARIAFKDDLPEEIVRRVTKSTPSDYYEQLYRRNAKTIRELLLDGALAQNDVLDRAMLEETLLEARKSNSKIAYPILRLAGVELWAQRWASKPAIPADRAA